MNEKSNYKFGVQCDRIIKGNWSFGVCISHAFEETYLFINFAIWSISVGWLYKGGADNAGI